MEKLTNLLNKHQNTKLSINDGLEVLKKYLDLEDITCKKSLNLKDILIQYDYLNEEILINEENLKNILKSYQSRFKTNEQTYFENVLTLKLLLTELERVKARKIVRQHKNDIEIQENDIETPLLGICIKDFDDESKTTTELEKLSRQYDKYYSISPEARITKLKALRTICTAIRDFDDIRNFFREEMYEKTLDGYTNNFGYPLRRYLETTGKDNTLNTFSWYSEHPSICVQNAKETFSLEKRLLYGLPINVKEQDDIQDRLYMLKIK